MFVLKVPQGFLEALSPKCRAELEKDSAELKALKASLASIKNAVSGL